MPNCTHWNKISCKESTTKDTEWRTQMSHFENEELKEKVFEDLCEELGHEPDEQTLTQAIEERMEHVG